MRITLGQRGRGTGRALLLAATAMTAALVSASPALADTGPDGEATGPATITVQTADAAVSCTLRANPSYRRASDNKVVGVGVVECRDVVARITVRTALYRNGTLVSDNGETTATNASVGIDVTDTACVSGSYRTAARSNVNGTAAGPVYSAPVTIRC